MFQHIRTALTHGFSQPILSNSIKIALVVGTMLNAINQGESIVVEGDVHWGSFLLNYMIPFCVSLLQRVAARDASTMRQAIETILPGTRAPCISRRRIR